MHKTAFTRVFQEIVRKEKKVRQSSSDEDEERGKDECHHRHQLQQDVDGRT